MSNNGKQLAVTRSFGVSLITPRHHLHVARSAATVISMTLALGAASACATKAGHSGHAITVEVEAPEGITADIVVKGPGKYERLLHGSETLEDVPVGEYTVSPVDRRARVAHAIVDTVWAATVTGSPMQVTDSAGATAHIRFDREPGSGRIWVPIANEDRIVSFAGDDLEGNAPPSVELETEAGSQPDAIAFDGRGNMWVSMTSRGSVVQFAASDLGQSGKLASSKSIDDVKGVGGIAFDPGGDLWMAVEGDKTVVAYTDVLYGTPKKKTPIGVAASPRNLAFDGAGNLFVATHKPASIVVFAKDALGASKPLPMATLSGPTSGLVSPAGVAFDGSGNLWVSNGSAGSAVRFDAALVATFSGEMDPAPSASLGAGEGSVLKGLAIDNAGAGWFATAHPGSAALTRVPGIALPSPVLGDERDLHRAMSSPLGLTRVAFDPPPRSVPLRR